MKKIVPSALSLFKYVKYGIVYATYFSSFSLLLLFIRLVDMMANVAEDGHYFTSSRSKETVKKSISCFLIVI